jgi:hypothetical protein
MNLDTPAPMSRMWSSMLRRQSHASMTRKLFGGVLAQGPMPLPDGVADFCYPPRTRRIADRPRARAGTQAATGGLTCARVTRNAHIAGNGGRITLPFPVQVLSRIVAPLGAANREDGLVFSLGLSYSRGRASSAPARRRGGPMRRISRKA